MIDTELLITEVEKRPALYDIYSKEYSRKQVKENCWAEIGAIIYEDWNSMSKEDQTEKATELIKKWKRIRDCFVRDIRHVCAFEAGQSSTRKRRYIFYDQLQFLLPYVKANPYATLNADLPEIADCSTGAPSSTIYEPKYQKGEDETLLNIAETSAENSDRSMETLVDRRYSKRRFRTQPFKSRARVALNNSFNCSARNLKVLTESLALQKDEMQEDAYGHRAFLLSFAPILNSLPLQPAMEARVKISQIITDTLAAVTERNSTQSDRLTIASPTAGIGFTTEYLIPD